MKHLLQVIVSALWMVKAWLDPVPVGFGRKSLDASPDECPVNVSGLHRFKAQEG
jgi:hypothetical protein